MIRMVLPRSLGGSGGQRLRAWPSVATATQLILEKEGEVLNQLARIHIIQGIRMYNLIVNPPINLPLLSIPS